MSGILVLGGPAVVYPFTVTDQVGRAVEPPADLSVSGAGGVVEPVVQGSTLVVHPRAVGSATLAFDGLAGSLDVTVVAPAPTTVTFGEPSQAE